MHIISVEIENFRNIALLGINLSPGVNIFYGDNGSGKTNLLEALFVLCLGRSHRAAAESVMVRQDTDFYRLEGSVAVQGEVISPAVAYQQGGRKRVTIDKVAVRLPELYERFSVVAAGPEDSDILSGAPSVRRRFIDIYLSQYSGKYLATLSSYQKALAQKNAALRNRMDPGPFNAVLVQTGAVIMKYRLDYIARLGESATEYYGEISGGGDLTVNYAPSVKLARDADSTDDISAVFEAALKDNLDREKMLETSLVGIHRDDVVFTINSLPARTHGSQGEWRTAAVALKLAVYRILTRERRFHPVLLLDEIFAELDHGRSEALMHAFRDFKQLFLTTAVEPPDFLKEGSRSYRIADGQVAEIM